jgi:tRNA(fMet)-specific endonuclease VapC
MGLILDSSMLIAAEREGKNARQVLTAIAKEIGETEVGISVMTLIELAHGAIRANTPERKLKREQFIGELVSAMPIYLVTVPVALRTGRLDGENQSRGLKVPLPDLLIGLTALELGYSVGTANLRHFNQIPGLSVVQL